MLEAECTRCKETFNPEGTDPGDLIHADCGGIGVIQGQWNLPGRVPTEEFNQPLTTQEQHGIERPNCSDSICQYHHPEPKREFDNPRGELYTF